MQAADVSSAVAAASAAAAAFDLPVEDAVVLHNSNKLALRLMPCDVFARVAHVGQEVAQLEVELGRRLADVGSRWAPWSLGWTRLCTPAMASQ